MINGTDLILSSVSATLSFIIAYEAFRARKFSLSSYLLNYFVGFLLLGLSFVIVLPIDLGEHARQIIQLGYSVESFPPRLIMQSIGFILIALAYSHSRFAKQLLLILTGSLIALVVLVLLPAVNVPPSVDIFLRIVNVAVLSYVLAYLLRFMFDLRFPRLTGLVFVGFLLELANQAVFAIHGVETVRILMFFAKVIGVAALVVLVCAFFVLQQTTTIDSSEDAHAGSREK